MNYGNKLDEILEQVLKNQTETNNLLTKLIEIYLR